MRCCGPGPNLYGYERGPVYRSTDSASGTTQTTTPTTSGTTAGGTSTPYTGSTGAYDAGAGVAAGATTGATGTPAGSGTVQTVLGSGQQAGNAAQAGQAAQGTATTSAPLSRTADTTPTLLPLGIAAAGTALLAYSKRRERIEREREQSDEQ